MRRAADGDADARERLIKAFWPHMGTIARTYQGLPTVDRAELMQEGVVGLLSALRGYDSDRGTPFWAYASWWVRQAMQHLVAQLTGPVVLSDRAARSLAQVKRARSQELQATGHDPSAGELAALTGLSTDHVERLMTIERAPRALDEPVTGDDETGGKLGDRIADVYAEDSYDRVVERLQIDDVAHLPDRLGDRERHVLRARYGLGQPTQTLREIAGALSVSAERVRQIEESALDHLRDDLAKRSPAAAGVDAGQR